MFPNQKHVRKVNSMLYRVINVYKPWLKPDAYTANIWQDCLPYVSNTSSKREYWVEVYHTFTIMLRGM